MLDKAAFEDHLGQGVAEPVAPSGISAADLAARANNRAGSVTAFGLQRWLLKQGLAVVVDGLLQPTARGRELGEGIEL
jgi:hypothetical protein